MESITGVDTNRTISSTEVVHGLYVQRPALAAAERPLGICRRFGSQSADALPILTNGRTSGHSAGSFASPTSATHSGPQLLSPIRLYGNGPISRSASGRGQSFVAVSSLPGDVSDERTLAMIADGLR